jgi:uncharacterized Zn finger protein
MTQLSLSEDEIRQAATEKSFERGEDSYDQGAVLEIVRRGRTVYAEVEGSEADPYTVRITFSTHGIPEGTCTCPYDYGGWCKHLVAVGLSMVRGTQPIESRPTLAQLLDRLNLVQTQGLIQALAEDNPQLLDEIECHVLRLLNPAPPRDTKRCYRPTVDLKPIRQEMREILRNGLVCLQEGHEDDPFTEEISNLLQQAQDFVEAGDGNNAIAILETITAAWANEWDELSDYGADVFEIDQLLSKAWVGAIATSDLSPPEKVDFAVMLSEWEEVLDADFSESLALLSE